MTCTTADTDGETFAGDKGKCGDRAEFTKRCMAALSIRVPASGHMVSDALSPAIRK
jgi:hypothetical protein